MQHAIVIYKTVSTIRGIDEEPTVRRVKIGALHNLGKKDAMMLADALSRTDLLVVPCVSGFTDLGRYTIPLEEIPHLVDFV